MSILRAPASVKAKMGREMSALGLLLTDPFLLPCLLNLSIYPFIMNVCATVFQNISELKIHPQLHI